MGSRRKFLLCIGGSFVLTMFSCNKGSQEESGQPKVDPCEDLSDLHAVDLKTRKGLAYVEESPHPDMVCSNCKFWLPPKEDVACGKCIAFRGPVYAKGHCTYWAPQL